MSEPYTKLICLHEEVDEESTTTRLRGKQSTHLLFPSYFPRLYLSEEVTTTSSDCGITGGDSGRRSTNNKQLMRMWCDHANGH